MKCVLSVLCSTRPNVLIAPEVDTDDDGSSNVVMQLCSMHRLDAHGSNMGGIFLKGGGFVSL